MTGRFEETAGTSESAYNHRLWAVRTTDFETFEAPFPLYDPGFSVIDGTFARDAAGGLHLIVKDETVQPPRKTLHVVSAQSPAGPFGAPAAAFSPALVEGPITATVDGRTLCYYDIYKEGRWGAAATRDFRTWEDVSARLTMPAGARHGSLAWVPRALVAALEA